jgi:hypothetical protein
MLNSLFIDIKKIKFQEVTKNDFKIVTSWIPDARSSANWAGPKVKFTIKLEQLIEAIKLHI